MNRYTITAAVALTASVGLGLASIGVGHVQAEATLPSTDTIYIIGCDPAYDDLTLFSVAPNGAATAIGNGNGNLDGKCAEGAAWDKKNQKAYFLATDPVTNELELWTTDITTGTPSKVSTIAGGEGFYISFDEEGAAQTQYDGVFYDLDMTTYTETELPSSQVNPDNSFYYVIQAFNFANASLYAINADNTEDDGDPIDNMLYTVDPSTGVVFGNTGPRISGLNDVGSIGSFAFDSAGTGWAIVDEDLYSFDTATATFTLQGPITDGSRFPGSIVSIFIAQTAPAGLPTTGSSTLLVTISGLLALVGVGAVFAARRRSTV